MEVWLEISTPDGRRHEVAAEIGPEATVAELRTSICTHLGLSDDVRLRVGRLGRTLEPQDRVAVSGLRSGDRIELRRGVAGAIWEAPNRIAIVAAGGPAAGTRFDLAEGDHSIGRGLDCDVCLPDVAMSRRHAAIRVAGDQLLVADAGSANGTFVDGLRVAEPVSVRVGHRIECGHTTLVITPGGAAEPTHPVSDGFVMFHRPPRVVRHSPEKVFKLPAPPARSIGRRQFEAELAEFKRKVAAVSAEMSTSLDEEVVDRRAKTPDLAELVHRAGTLAPELWERRTTYADFLDLRLGTADLPSLQRFELAEGGDDQIRAETLAELGRWSTVRAAPVTLDVDELGVIGLCGESGAVAALGRSLLTQLAVLHSPKEVAVAIAVTDEARDDWSWATWLPHLQRDFSPFAAPSFAVGSAAGGALVEALASLVVNRRLESSRRPGQTTAPGPAIVAFVAQQLDLPPSAVATVVEDGPSTGVRVIWMGASTAEMPESARVIVEVSDRPASFTLAIPETGAVVTRAVADLVSVEAARDVALRIAGVRDASTGRGRGAISRRASLAELLGLTELSSSRIQERWGRSANSLDTLVGVSATGPFGLDLRADGPHALVGGTTGAGKSELLQTWVASLAASHPPNRVTFLLVDFKGGSAFKDLVALPHTVGFATNLDAHLASRVLISLDAELHRREEMLRAHGAKDLIEMERRVLNDAPPVLILIVDEYAKLAAELPEFVDDIAHVAQRGRSLGIHLVLATQRPAGTINDVIRANTNLRIALRMNDVADSEDVIGTSDAAALPRTLPGRGFARTGQGELTEFQVASVGGHTVTGSSRSTDILIRTLRDGMALRPESAVDTSAPTDLQRMVDVIGHATRAAAIPSQPQPWMPPLPESIPLWSIADAGRIGVVAIGVIDLPRQQAQESWCWRPDIDGSMLVCGASEAGKTTLLRTMAVSIAQQHRPEQVRLHVIDFGHHGLAALESIPHVGSVIHGDDEDRIRRLITELETEVVERRARLADAGVSAFDEYGRGGDRPTLARVVVLLDGLASFQAASERAGGSPLVERLWKVVDDGRPLGIHFVLTADRAGAVSAELASLIRTRVVLRMGAMADYATLGVDMALMRHARGEDLPPGRGFVGSSIEFHATFVGADPSAEAQIRAIREVGAELVRRYSPDGH